MSYPNIPNITPSISVNREQVVNLLLASIALEELGLSHIINSEAEKIQYILGTLPGQVPPAVPPTISQLMQINKSVDQTMKTVIKKQMLLEFKLSDVLNIPEQPANPSISIQKLISVDGGVTYVHAPTLPGPTLTPPNVPMYKLIITNTGNVTLTGVSVEDPKLGVHTIGGILAPGASFEIPVTGIFALGQQTNTATVTGSFDGESVQDSDTANYFGVGPSIDIQKLISVDGGLTWVHAPASPGPTLLFPQNPMYRLIVTNTGNVTLTFVTVEDPTLGIHNIGGILAPGASFEIPVTGTFLPGQQTNTATATGMYSGITVKDSDTANYLGVIASIDVEKEVSADNGVTWIPSSSAPGPVIPSTINPQFRFTVTNNGTVTLDNIQVTDDVFGLIGTLPTLAAGTNFRWIITVPWVAGQHVNTATATGEFEGQIHTDTESAHYFGI